MFVTLAFEVLAFVAFAVLVAGVPYVRRKRGYWTSRGVRLASGRRALVATLPGARLDDRTLNRHRTGDAAVLGLHDGGRPCALACDARAVAAAMANDGFADLDARPAGGRGCSLVPSVVDAQAMVAVLPAMTECVTELITSLEAVANRRLVFVPWSETRQCAATVVATCVYGQPMVHSKVKAFAEQCDRALQSSGRGRPTVTDYFAAYDLSADRAQPASTDFKRLLMAAAADDDKIGSDVADERVRSDMFEFVAGAIEPTATLVTAALYELARDKDVQNRLREHLDSVLDHHQQQITMDQLVRLSYLENVIRETLRKYPLATTVRRVTTRPYTVPDPRDGGNRVTLEQGTMTVVPVYAIHHDGRNFDQPEAFRPHRFPGQLSAAYVPHGSGPRSYIGKHFVELEATLILAMLISRYEVHVDGSKFVRSPDPFDPTSFAGVRFVVTNRDGDRTMAASLRKLEQCVKQERKFLFF